MKKWLLIPVLLLALRHGCKAYQDYLFGKPVPIDEFEKLFE